MKHLPAKSAPLARDGSLPPIASPSRVIIMRTWTDDHGEERTIDLIEPVRPGLIRTYRETRKTKPEEFPRKG